MHRHLYGVYTAWFSPLQRLLPPIFQSHFLPDHHVVRQCFLLVVFAFDVEFGQIKLAATNNDFSRWNKTTTMSIVSHRYHQWEIPGILGAKVGGRCHSTASGDVRSLADVGATRLKPDIVKIKREDPEWSAPSIASALTNSGLNTRKETSFKPPCMRRHVQQPGS